jgi:hypothetical protein
LKSSTHNSRVLTAFKSSRAALSPLIHGRAVLDFVMCPEAPRTLAGFAGEVCKNKEEEIIIYFKYMATGNRYFNIDCKFETLQSTT